MIAGKTMRILVIAGIWVVFSVAGLFLIGFRSSSLKPWIIAIVAFPFLYVAFEGGVELFRRMPLTRNVRKAVDEATKERSFSGLRVLYLLIETLVILSLTVGVWYIAKVVVGRWFF